MVDFATLVLGADTRQLRGAVGDLDDVTKAGGRAEGQAEKSSKAFLGMSRAMAGAAAAAVTLAAGLAGALSMRRFIDATVKMEAGHAQLEAAILSTGGAAGKTLSDLNEHAAALQRITNYGDETINTAQGLLLTFTNISGSAFDEATVAVLNLSTAMGGDLSGAALQVGKALNDPVLGMTALSRSGIQFSEAQKEAVAAMVELNDIAGAQTIILAELERQFGGSAEAARGTLGGALSSLGNAWGDLFEVGSAASEGLREAVESLIESITDPKFVNALQGIGVALFGMAEVGVRAISGLSDVFGFVADNIDVFAISVGVLAATRMPALIAGAYSAVAGFIAYNGIVGIATIATTVLSAAMFVIPFVAIVAGLTLMYRSFQDNVSAAQSSAQAFSNFTNATGQLATVTANLEADYKRLAAAREAMTDATQIGTGVERQSAIEAVSGINARITANEQLRQVLALTQESELNAMRQAELAAATHFETRASLIAAGALLRAESPGELFGYKESMARIERDGVDAVTEAYMGLIAAQISAGEVITDVQQLFFDSATAVDTTRQAVIDAQAALDLMQTPVALAEIPPAIDAITTLLAAASSAAYEAIPPMSELRAEYGDLAQAAYDLMAAQNALAEADAARNFVAVIDKVAALENALISAGHWTGELVTALLAARNAETFDEMASEAVSLADAMADAAGGAQYLEGEARLAYEALLDAGNAALGIAAAAGQISFGGAIASANALADSLGVSLALSRALQGAGVGTTGAVVFDPRDPHFDQRAADRARTALTMQDLADERDRPSVASYNRAPTGGGGGGGGGGSGGSVRGGGGGGGGASEADREAEAIQRVIDGLNEEMATIGMSDQAKRLHNELRSAGVDVMSAEGQQIADLVEQLTNAEAAQESLENLQDGIQGLSSDISGAILGADSFADALINLAEVAANALNKIADSLLTSGIDSLISAMFGIAPAETSGGGLLDTVFGGFRAKGGPVEAGKGYIVGENGPEPFFPATSGVVLPNSSLSSASGGAMSMTVNVNLSGANGDAAIEAAAQRGVQQAVSQVQRELSTNPMFGSPA